MIIKFFQLNIFKGKYLDGIIDFVRENNIDICHFQEVSGGTLSYHNSDNFNELRQKLGYKGAIIKTIIRNEPTGYFGNATLLKRNFRVVDKKIVWLRDFDPGMVEINDKNGHLVARAALFLKFEAGGRSFYSINTHLAWGKIPFDADYKVEQAEKLAIEIAKLDKPWILSGDFNVDSDTEVVKMFEQLGRNLLKGKNIQTTLNPNEHYLGKEALENKIAIDYIFVSPEISFQKFELVTENLSDHYGLYLEFDT